MASYQIQVTGLKLHGFHGVLSEEKSMGQFFILDLTMEVKKPNPMPDDPNLIVNYAEVTEKMVQIFSAKPHQLIESLAEAILEGLSSFTDILNAKLTIKKPAPPIPRPMEHVSVTLSKDYL